MPIMRIAVLPGRVRACRRCSQTLCTQRPGIRRNPGLFFICLEGFSRRCQVIVLAAMCSLTIRNKVFAYWRKASHNTMKWCAEASCLRSISGVSVHHRSCAIAGTMGRDVLAMSLMASAASALNAASIPRVQTQPKWINTFYGVFV